MLQASQEPKVVRVSQKVELYPDGSYKLKENYLNDKLHGLQEYWYINGVRLANHYYFNGKLQGFQKAWYNNGKPERKGYCVNGQHHGFLEEWHHDGSFDTRGNYVDGKLHGLREIYYPGMNEVREKEYYIEGNKVDEKTHERYQTNIRTNIQTVLNKIVQIQDLMGFVLKFYKGIRKTVL